ncbi:MAG: putative repeat protein (TIGR03806 family) [Bradymonadia bacterium]|jgi:uncharacterized repeat protein (TIGR03806 family)
MRGRYGTRRRWAGALRPGALLAGALALGCTLIGCAQSDQALTLDRGADAAGGQGGAGGNPEPEPQPDAPAENPLAPRVDNTTCSLPPAPPIGDMQLVEAFPALDFERPIWMGHAHDGTDRLYVIQQGGVISMFDPDNPTESATFLNLSVSRAGNEEGLLGVAFHPEFAANGRFYIYYSAASPRRSVVSMFTRRPNGTADPGSEQVILEIPQPFGNHNGGDLRFGPDGYLYIALGDGGSAGDPQNHAQRPETLLGAVLRIDVDRPDPVCGTPYGFPADNPFYVDRCQGDMNAGRPEVYAWGLRNIWRMAFDRGTGELWAADVGQDDWEEINIIERGGNYGWRPVEGERCFRPDCDVDAYDPPVHVYGHDEGESITGGFVYRGAALPELWGAYIFADYVSGRIWALNRRDDASEVVLLADTEHRISSFGEDAAGELYVITFSSRLSLLSLRRRGDAIEYEPVPELLSETGCFADVATGQVAPGVIPYAPIAPFWSDGAQKDRYFALPAGTRMTWRAEDAFDFPDGSVLIKTFDLPNEAGETRRLEVRLLHKDDGRWYGYTYKMLPDGSDARLTTGRLNEQVDGPRGPQTWNFLDRGQCQKCHTPEANFILGATSRQLNWDFDYGGVRYNQLQALDEVGYLDLPSPPADLPRFAALGDRDAPIADRARAWLDTNCASCHLEGGRVDAEIDLRATVDLADMRVCDVEPRHTFGAPDARLLVPGDAQASVLYTRLVSREDDMQMPPLGSTVVDTQGRDLVRAWIQSIPACP